MVDIKTFDIFRKRWTELDIEVPSWGFGRGGTRFGTYPTASDPGNAIERIKKASRFHELTGKGKKIALHFPWDGANSEDVESLKKALNSSGLKAGSINANFFSMRPDSPLDDRLRYGGLISPFDDVREACLAHTKECVEYMRLLESDTLVLWLPDGSNSPGQASFYDMTARLLFAFQEITEWMEGEEKILIEYKPFEPAFYATAIPDWGSAFYFCAAAGDNAGVLVDLGHHLHGTNVEQIIATLILLKRFAGFHFNDSKYADDDLATGSLNPAELFRIFVTLLEGEMHGLVKLRDLAFMIDESHNIKDPLEEMIESLMNIETAFLKALLVDFKALETARTNADPTLADAVLRDAFLTDVRGSIAQIRKAEGLPEDPFAEAVRSRGAE